MTKILARYPFAKFEIWQIPAYKDNYIFLMVHQQKAVAIDACEAGPLLSVIKEQRLQLEKIISTHHHWDHVGGNLEVQRTTSCEIWGSDNDVQARRIPGASRGLKNHEKFFIFDVEFESLYLPGHTLGAHSLYSAQAGLVFTGDTLFTMGCGRLLEGTAEQLYSSLQILKKLPDNTQVFCGHEYTVNNLAFIESLNPQPNGPFQSHKTEVFDRRRAGKPAVPSPLGTEKALNPFLLAKNLSEFKTLRLKKDDFQLEEQAALR